MNALETAGNPKALILLASRPEILLDAAEVWVGAGRTRLRGL